jgi:polysaccharide export outer membrane protein
MHGWRWRLVGLWLTAAVGPAGGCMTPVVFGPPAPHVEHDLPRELAKVSLPTYRVEPPDVLLVDAIKVVPREPYQIEALDILRINVEGALVDRPIEGEYPVGSGGQVDLGPPYGLVRVAGLTIDQATTAIEEHLRQILQAPLVSVSLSQPAAQQQIIGEHIVGPDGTLNLGSYGSVYVSGMTLEEARAAIEEHLGEFLEAPKVSVDVFAYNSKVYYVITPGAGQGDGVQRVPITGNETVLDAVAQIAGLQAASSKRMWVARPAPDHLCYDQVLPVDWDAIVEEGDTTTNYQLLPGDRLYIAENKLLALDNLVTQATQPFERIFGFTLLGAQSIQTLNRFPQGFNQQGLLGL